MSKKINFIWIDDEPNRKASSDHLKETLKLSGLFIDVKGDYTDGLKALFKKPEPDIILIDHNLKDISSGVFKKGSTFAAYIRETWPDCPIVCITGEDITKVDYQKRSLYEDIFSITKISKHYPTILSIAKSFRKLKEDRPKDVDDLLALMKSPKEDHERLRTIIPQDLKENFKDKSHLLNISHWLRETFLKRAGFVYDRLWLSTTLGIKESSFHKVENIFSKAKYTGIFADESNPVWWKSSALELLAAQVKEAGLPWENGRKIPVISKRDFSSCYSSGEDFPETVAYVDEAKDAKRAPMKLKYTESHPNFEDLLFFEEVRVMKS
jgi:CheY-like chemotaxis protein